MPEPHPTRLRGAGATERDTADALDALGGIGVRPSLWRPPYGDVQPWTAEVAHGFGLRLCGWSVDPEDWRGDGAAAMLERSVDRIEPGAIVVCHDGAGPGAAPTETFDTPQLVREPPWRDWARARSPFPLLPRARRRLLVGSELVGLGAGADPGAAATARGG